MKNTLVAAALLSLAGGAFAKIPAPVLDDAAKAKAAEAAAKTAWQAKIDAYKLCKAQDRVAAAYRKSAPKAAAADAQGAAKAASAPVAAMPAAAPATAAPAAPTTAGVPGTTGTPVTGTPVAFTTPPPCMDPGPFAYNPPSQTPLETSGAHSPAGTAKSPPSVRAEAAKIQPPAKK